MVWHRARREGSSPCWVATGGQRRAGRAGVRRGKRRGKRSGEGQRRELLRAAEEEAGAQVVRDGEGSREGKDSEQRRELAAGTSDGESELAQDWRRRRETGSAGGASPSAAEDTDAGGERGQREGRARARRCVVVLRRGTAMRLPLDGRRERARATSVTATEAVVLEGGGWSGVAGGGSG